MLGAPGNGSQPADAPHKTQTPAAGQRLDSRILRVPSSEYKTIQAAIDDAKDGDTILVAPTHEETGEVSVDRGVTITTEGGDGASRGGASVNGIFNITASNVSLNGFRLSPRAAARCAIRCSDASDIVLNGNIISQVYGLAEPGGAETVNVCGIEVVCDDKDVTNITITNNQISGVIGDEPFKAAQGINVCGSGSHSITNLIITNNTISGVQGHRGAYAIALEGNTPGALVCKNSISDVTAYGPTGDAAAIVVNDNNGADTIVIRENSFAGVAFAVRNLSGLLVDASANWYGTTDESSVAAMVSENVDFTPWLGGGTDLNRGFSGDFSRLWVTAAGGQTGSANRIQEAVDLLPSGESLRDNGGEISIAPGIYEGQIEISGSSTRLIGEGTETNPSIVQSLGSLPLFFMTGTTPNYPIIYIHDATNVSIENLWVDGLGRGNGNYRFYGIAFWNAGGAVTDCVITNIHDTPLGGRQHGICIFAFNADGVPRTLNVTDSDLAQYQKNGMALMGEHLTVQVSGCTVTGCGPLGSGMPAQNGIQICDGASGSIVGCLVRDHIYTSGTWAATGIVLDSCGPVAVRDTTLIDNFPGVYCVDTSASVDGLVVENFHPDSGDGFYAYNSTSATRATPARPLPAPFESGGAQRDRAGGGVDMSVTITNSAFWGHDGDYSWGIGAFGSGTGTVDLTITHSTIEDWDVGIIAYYDPDEGCTGPVSLSAHKNAIVSNHTYGLKNEQPSEVDAQNNWWGDASGPEDPLGSDEATLTECFDPALMKNGDGLGDAVSDLNVNYCPWLGAPATVELVLPGDAPTCYRRGDTLAVELRMVNATTEVIGGQFRLWYDATKLTPKPVDDPESPGGTALCAVSGDAPFTRTTARRIDYPTPGLIDYAVGVPTPPGTGTAADTVMARLYFTVKNDATDACSASGLVAFYNVPETIPTRLTTPDSTPIYPVEIDLPALAIDSTPPALSPESSVADGSLDAGCGATVPVNVVLRDACGLLAGDVNFTMAATSGTLDYSSITKTQTDDYTVTIAGGTTLTGVTACSATVTITVDAYDCRGNHLPPQEVWGTWSDTTPPTFTAPVGRSQNADAGLGTAVLVPAIAAPTPLDCNPATMSYQREGFPPNTGLTDPYPVGTTQIIWTATDACDNESAPQIQTVTVLPYSDLVVHIELQGDIVANVTRCVRFIFRAPSGQTATLDKDIEFTPVAYPDPGVGNRGVADVVFTDLPISPPYDAYTCVTAEDELHTLTVQALPEISGTAYRVDFTGDYMLIQGDLIDMYDGDRDYVDILDYAVFINQWGQKYAGSTCDTLFPHADLDGDGGVEAGDFGFISGNFWMIGDAPCDGLRTIAAGSQGGPRASITLAELHLLGLSELASADLNGDRILDVADIEAFLSGVRPAPLPEGPAMMGARALQPAAVEAESGLLEFVPREPEPGR
jgi:hypothetical protein